MKKLGFAVLLVALAGSPVFSGEVKGLINEFMEVEDYLSKKKPSPEFRKNMLERNLLDSLKTTLARKFKTKENELKKLSIEDIDYERQAQTFKFYIRYKTYYIFYDFATDPEIYIQLPKEEILYVRPDSFDKNAPHKEDTTVMPDPKR